jgi:hypothetical protein
MSVVARNLSNAGPDVGKQSLDQAPIAGTTGSITMLALLGSNPPVN